MLTDPNMKPNQPIQKRSLKLCRQVENRGPSDIESAEVYILWPSLRGEDQPLLYLTGQPIVEGPGSCHYVSDVNTHNIKVKWQSDISLFGLDPMLYIQFKRNI